MTVTTESKQKPLQSLFFLSGNKEFDPNKFSPYRVVFAGMLAAFLLFLFLDTIEQILIPEAGPDTLRLLHFFRGFLSTSGGMAIVFWVMHVKEVELVKLRDHFAEQVVSRTEELSEANRKLTLEIGQREETQEKLRHCIERFAHSNASLERFAKIASHDLQEPLRAINGYACLLKRRYTSKLDDNADQYLESMLDATRRMEALIADILTHAEYKAGHKPFELLDCNEIVDEVTKNLSATISESRCQINKGCLPKVMGDKSQLIQLFQNLLSNAIKFRGTRPVKVEISARHDDHNIIFSVKDNGIGIEPCYQAQIFEMFTRLHGRNDYPGTGVGLAICKTIVENHRGKIWVESEPGKGCTFLFSIPNSIERTYEEPQQSAAAAAKEARNGNGAGVSGVLEKELAT